MTETGELYCWGLLGFLPDAPASYVPTAIEVGQPLASVSVGWDSICGITPDAALLCWGNNELGQVGDGTTRFAEEPRQLAGRYRNVAVSYATACAVDLTGAGWCWGRNNVGQLGNGVFDGASRALPHPDPTRVKLDASIDRIIVGPGTGCALATTGEVYCWGAAPVLGNKEGVVDCSVNWPMDSGACRPYPKRVR